jgi:hypothetical protein
MSSTNFSDIVSCFDREKKQSFALFDLTRCKKEAINFLFVLFISGMKDGYDTYCGERGFQPSGGQKQGLALAGAILKDLSINPVVGRGNQHLTVCQRA